MGIYYVSHDGVYHFTGLQTYKISETITLFDDSSTPHVEKDLLHLCYGCYYPEKNWLVWAVPVNTGTTPTANTHLLVFDLTFRSWMPLQTLPVTALSTAFEYLSTAPGKIGPRMLIAGDGSGRILKLFDSTDTDDNGTTISSWVETGWLTLESWEVLRHISLYAKTEGTSITIKVYLDGSETEAGSRTFTRVDNLSNSLFAVDWQNANFQGRAFKLRIEWEKPTTIYGVSLEVHTQRMWGPA
jgi:hypothetical protein